MEAALADAKPAEAPMVATPVEASKVEAKPSEAPKEEAKLPGLNVAARRDSLHHRLARKDEDSTNSTFPT